MAIGVKALNQYRTDLKPLRPRKAITAFCADCMGGYDDGPQDCESTHCPLYPYHPYNKNRVRGTRKVVVDPAK